MSQRLILPKTTLLEFLREELNLTGTKNGCDQGDCGCCTVLLNDKPVLSCLLLALEVQNQNIVTIEGIADGIKLHPVQETMTEEGALQCGYCTPAMILNAVYLLKKNQSPSVKDIKTCISGTICRCTGYTKIEKAIASAAKKLYQSAKQ
ncbi:MAG: (2Fe-2S)-binding protein [Deltaproteobacteria bacterium]|nr:(2Fe-2S)-binding protein [Deltaproteobacteria bacterium]